MVSAYTPSCARVRAVVADAKAACGDCAADGPRDEHGSLLLPQQACAAWVLDEEAYNSLCAGASEEERAALERRRRPISTHTVSSVLTAVREALREEH
jgi:hypothetical protein